MAAPSTGGGNSSRRHIRDSASLSSREPRDREHDTASSIKGDGGDCEEREALRQRELEEAKGRAAQMEKTMRWWSDCTANWREKWSKVRTERNQARDECKLLKSKLEASLKESMLNKREKEELSSQNERLKKEMEKIHMILLKQGSNFESQLLEVLGDDPLKHFAFSNDSQNDILSNQNHLECDTTVTLEPEIAQKLENRGSMSPISGKSTPKSDKMSPRGSNFGTNTTNTLNGGKSAIDEEFYRQKLVKLQLKLDETTKKFLAEKEENLILSQKIENLTAELTDLKEKSDELREAKQEVVRELLSLQDDHEKEIQIIKSDFLDEVTSRENMDKKLGDLRAEVERLQVENSTEWAKRERIETEKINLDRENKKLKNEIRDIQERLEKKGSLRSLNSSDLECRHMQQELHEKNIELTDVKHSHSKLKKALQEKTTELSHALRRAEQYENEVKKLRTRVEELKHDLATVEDELDAVTTHSKKLQSTNEELQEQVDSFQIQLQHLHTRPSTESVAKSFGDHLPEYPPCLEKEDGGEEMAVFDDSECIT